MRGISCNSRLSSFAVHINAGLLLSCACSLWFQARSELYLVSLPAPLAWKNQVFPDSTLPSPEGLVKLIRFTMGSRNERCRDIGTSGLPRLQSLALKIDLGADRCASGRVVLHLSVRWHSNSTRFSTCNTIMTMETLNLMC
jgi:hypothetical protein